VVDNRVVHNRMAHNRMADSRVVDNRVVDNRVVDSRVTDDRVVDSRMVANRSQCFSLLNRESKLSLINRGRYQHPDLHEQVLIMKIRMLIMSTIDQGKLALSKSSISDSQSPISESGMDPDPGILKHTWTCHDAKARCSVCLQNALKIFKKMPSALMDIVKGTDPTTVTQHGLYMRPLTDPSLHPLLALKPLDKPPEQPAPPGTPPREEKERLTSAAASGQVSSGQVSSSESGSAAAVCQPDQVVNPEAAKEAEGPSSALTAGNALAKAANALSLNCSAADDKATKPDENNLHGNPLANSPSGPALTSPALEGSSQMSKGSSEMSKGSSSSPMGAALGALSKPEGKADGEPAAPEGSSPASEGHPVGTGFTPQGGDPSTQPVGDSSQLWGRGRVTLLGDAAHATIPNGY